MRAALFAAVLVLAASPAIADVNVAGNHQKINVECGKHKIVNISGNHAVITLSGACDLISIAGNHATVRGSVDRVLIDGNNNKLALDAVDQIVVRGNKNIVSFKKGNKEKAPVVTNFGNENNIGPNK